MMKKKDGHAAFDDHSLHLDDVKQEIEAIQVGNSSNGDSSRAANTPGCRWEEEMMVGFEDEAINLKEQLTRGPKQLQIISIVGMPGLGKTTLARNLYNDPLIAYHFHIRAWINVSQEYQKRNLLLQLFRTVIKHSDGIDQMTEERLVEQVYKRLKQRPYFIVMDDIWDSRAWVDLKNYFPDDNNGSRIMFTSRLTDQVALHAKPSSSPPPLSLRFLTHDESWDLLQQKVFHRESCPPDLMEIGKEIAEKCGGLPLAIAVVAGILANEEKRQDRWKQVGETINSRMVVDDPQLWANTLALSYNHLPPHLKPCFLYFAAFSEDAEIPVGMLTCFWIAEGFIPKTGGKSLEEVAEEYLMDLIGRSLVLVSKRRYNGTITNCGVHDLLLEFCIKKAEEERFLKHILDHHFSSSSPASSTSKYFSCVSRLCFRSEALWNSSFIPSSLNTSSLICDDSEYIGFLPPTFLSRCFKHLRVLHIRSIEILRCPREIGKLVSLRYLALGALFLSSESSLPFSISSLSNLETLILYPWPSVTSLECIRTKVNLRHLCLVGSGVLKIERQNPNAACYPFSLDNLQTLSWVDPWSCEDILAKAPNLRELGFRGEMVSGKCLTFPHLDFLNHLQSLRLSNSKGNHGWSNNLFGRVKLPTNLKTIHLEKTYLKWDEMSTLGKLAPNLECLKLLDGACSGQSWEPSDDDFPRLKFLKFVDLNIVWWNASSNHFPRLQQLVFVRCYKIKKIPSQIGDISTLETIKVYACNGSMADSAWKIKEEQQILGNHSLQMKVHY